MTTSIVYVNTTDVTITLSNDQGPQGATGTAASIVVGSTTTGSAGSSAAVANSGTSTAAILDFTIPTGPTGPTGATGAAGVVQSITGTAPITVGGTAAIPVIGITQGSLTIAESQVTNLVTDLAAKAPLASPTFTGTLTTPIAVVTGSTVPANGIYLPAANTLGLATNSTSRFQIGATGDIGFGAADGGGRAFNFKRNITGYTSAYGIIIQSTVQSDVTSDADMFYSNPSTVASAFTLSALRHFYAEQGTIGATSSVTTQQAFFAGSSLTGATNNYGFYGNIASGSNRWNAYMGGTAANYFAGQTTVGSTSLTLGSGSVAQQFGVVSTAAANVGAVIRGAASQTGDLTQWQDSAGTVLARVDSAGKVGIGSAPSYPLHVSTTSASAVLIAETDNAISPTTNAPTLTIQNLSNTTNAWSGINYVDAAGSVAIGTHVQYTDQTNHYGSYSIYSRGTDGYFERFKIASNGGITTTGAAATVALIAKGAASQTANLQEWQNSGATVLTAVNASGTINFASGNTSATATIGAVTAPALVSGYITMQVAGTTVKVPYYNN